MNLWKKIEVGCGIAAALSGVAIILDLFARSDRIDGFSSWLSLFLSSIPSLVFGVASCFHAAKSKTSAMVVMFVAGPVNNALIVSFGLGILYVLSVLHDTWGLLALIANFVFVLIGFLAVFVGWDPFRDDPQTIA